MHQGRFGEADVRLLATIAANVGVAIQNAQLYEEMRRRAEEMAALADVGRELSATTDLSRGARAHSRTRAAPPRGGQHRRLPYGNRMSQELRATVALGKNADEIRADPIVIGQGIIGDLAARGVAQVVNDTSVRSTCSPRHGHGTGDRGSG